MWEVKALKAERSRLLDLINGVFDGLRVKKCVRNRGFSRIDL